MSDDDEWNAFYERNPPLSKRNAVPYIRIGLGRKGKAWGYPDRPGEWRDYVPAAEWRPLRTAALAAAHKEFAAGHLHGQKVGGAFMELVIGDPKVQACGEWLCREREEFRALFTEGKFPVPIQRRPTSRHWSPGPTYARVAYPAAKERFRGLPSGTLSNNGGQFNPPWPEPAEFTIRWDDKWPVVLAAGTLSGIFSSAYEPQASYQTDPSEGPIHHAAEALADRHKAFFDLLRGRLPQVTAYGTTAAGDCVPIDGAQWGRADRSLDIVTHDVWCTQPPERLFWSGVTLRRPAAVGVGALASEGMTGEPAPAAPAAPAAKVAEKKPIDARGSDKPKTPSRSELATAKRTAVEKIKNMMLKNQNEKTIELKTLKERWIKGGGIPHLSERGLEQAWGDALKEAKLPVDSPWKKRGPRRRVKK